MSVPPLHERILDTSIHTVTSHEGNGQFDGIDNMQHGHSYPGGDIKPDGHIDMAFPSFDNRAKHINAENDPDNGNGDVDRPFQFRVFLTACFTCPKGNCRLLR